MQPPDDPTYFYRAELFKSGSDWLTENQRLFWRRRAELTRFWRNLASARAKEAGIPHLDNAHIVAELRFADSRRRDPANWMPTAKAAVDGLVDAGVFTDDNAKFVTGPDLRLGPVVSRGFQSMHLLIYPTERPVKITGEYRQCPECERPYEKDYPHDTAFTIRRWVQKVELTPHHDDCERAANDDRA